MADRRQDSPSTNSREARLKAALKANIARRKARAQVLDAKPPPEDPHGDEPLAPPEED